MSFFFGLSKKLFAFHIKGKCVRDLQKWDVELGNEFFVDGNIELVQVPAIMVIEKKLNVWALLSSYKAFRSGRRWKKLMSNDTMGLSEKRLKGWREH